MAQAKIAIEANILGPSLGKLHHMGMFEIERYGSGILKLRRRATALLLAIVFFVPAAIPSFAQNTEKVADDRYYEPLPQETGAAGLKLMLRRAEGDGGVMEGAGGADEGNRGRLYLESRGKSVLAVMNAMKRAAGGPNKKVTK